MRGVLCLLVISSFLSAVRCQDPALDAAKAFYDGIVTDTLPNGLRVVLKPIAGSPLVTTMMAYQVGAGDEELTATGLSHYLEHLMFKGTDRLMPGDIDRQTLRNGGHNNAWTNEDMTVYHFDFAADRWEVALDVEADRMRNLKIDDRHEFQQEKGAVIAELDGNEDNPFDLERKAILPRLFGKEAPYGHPVIGEKPHVRDATAEVIKSHYDRWYHPNNAILVIVGGFDPNRAKQLVREKFAAIPAGNVPKRKTAEPIKRAKPEVHEFTSKFESPRFIVGFNTIAVGHSDEPALDLVASLLTGGKTGRLYRKLVEDLEMASSVRAMHQAGRLPGWFAIEVELMPDKSPSDVERIVLDELERIADQPPTDAELNRAKRLLVAGEVFAKEGVHSLAEDLAVATSLRGLDGLRQWLGKLMVVTPADIQRAAQTYLNADTRVVVRSLPKSNGGGAAPIEKPKPRRRTHGVRDSALGYDLTKTQRVILPNGLTLLLLENHRLPMVCGQVVFRNVRLSEPADKAGVASMVGSLLEEGTQSKTGQQIATLIEDVGGELALSPSGGSVRVLTPDLKLGLDVLFDCLMQPSFPADAFERTKAAALAALDEAETRPDTKAELLFQSLNYGEHPLGRPSLGFKNTLAALTPEDCRAFHAATFVPDRGIFAVVGDFDAKTVQAQIERLTANWNRGKVAAPSVALPKKKEQGSETIVSMSDASQLYIHVGHLGIRRADPDFYSLLVMDYILGTGTGFTDRLSSKLRDRMGLAYTVSANITGTAGDQPGLFNAFVGTFADKFALVKAGLLAEIRRIRDEPPTHVEVEDAKRYLLGSLPFRYATADQVAEQLLQIERFGLGLNYFDEFRRRVGTVTAADVQAAARKHLDLERMVVVAVGAIDKCGKALK